MTDQNGYFTTYNSTAKNSSGDAYTQTTQLWDPSAGGGSDANKLQRDFICLRITTIICNSCNRYTYLPACFTGTV